MKAKTEGRNAVDQGDEIEKIDTEYRRLWLRFQEADSKGQGMRLTPWQVHVLAQTAFAEPPCIADGN